MSLTNYFKNGDVMKKLFLATLLLLSMNAKAESSVFDVISMLPSQLTAQNIFEGQAINWKIGDVNNYKVNLGGFINGTMVMKVRSVGADGIWVDNDIDAGGRKQKREMLFDLQTGEPKRVIVDGKEENMADGEQIIESTTPGKIKVPAGTYDCSHVVMKAKKDNARTDVWLNPTAIPMSGALKMVSPTSFGKLTLELTSFKKASN